MDLAANPLSVLLHSWNGPFGRRFLSDVTVNVLLYVPLGLSGWRAFSVRHRVVLTIAAGAVLSASIEMLQIFTPARQCSGFDLLDNIAGTALGVTFASFAAKSSVSHRVGTLFGASPNRPAVLLLALWLVSALFPFFPVTSLFRLSAEASAFTAQPWFEPVAFATAAITWFIAAHLITAAGLRHPKRWILLSLLVTPAQFFVVSRAPAPSALLGAGCSTLLFLLAGANSRGWVAAALLLLIAWRGLTPFTFTAHNHFLWTPFAGSMASSEWQRGIRILLEKLFLYSAAVWLLTQSRVPLPAAAVVVAGVLGAIEVAQTNLPGHVAEVTDPILALAAGVVLDRAQRSEKNS